jgi:glycine/D-amino acid oxidase-like deaminating enzyme
VDLRSGVPVWLADDSPSPPAFDRVEDLRGPLDCDVAVVGTGVTGALVAWQLVRAGLDVIMLDRRAPGRGSTAASTALIQYEIDTPLLDLRRAIGRVRADRAYLAAGRAVGRLGEIIRESESRCGYEEVPSLCTASREADAAALRQEGAARQELGFALSVLSSAEIGARFPFTRPAGLLSESAAQLNPFELTRDLLVAAIERGARVRTGPGASLHAIEQHAGVQLCAAGGAVTARHVVLATGYESQVYLPAPVASLQSTYAIATWPGQPLETWDRRCLVWETARPYLYLRTTPDGRVLVGGEDEADSDPKRRDALIELKSRRLAEKGRELFPAIDFAPQFAWAGTFAETRDGLPYIGCPAGMSDVWFALGYGGNGITFAALAADIIRDALCGEGHEDADLFTFDR